MGATHQGLEYEGVANHMLPKQVESQQRGSEVIEHAHEQNHIEFLLELIDLVDIQLAELDFGASHVSRKSRLCQVCRVRIDAEYARGAAPLHFDGVKTGVASDVEHA